MEGDGEVQFERKFCNGSELKSFLSYGDKNAFRVFLTGNLIGCSSGHTSVCQLSFDIYTDPERFSDM